MKRLSGIFLLCLSVSAASAADKPTSKESLADYAKKTQGRQAYGVYFQNAKIGWMISETKLVRRDGKDVVLVLEEALFEINRGEEKTRIESKTVPFQSPTANRRPSAVKATQRWAAFRLMTTRAFPVARSQRRIVLSALAEASRSLSRATARLQTAAM
jgi:hypothetical protein